MMSRCCIRAFALDGIEHDFALAPHGETLTCPTCKRRYVKNHTTWVDLRDVPWDANGACTYCDEQGEQGEHAEDCAWVLGQQRTT